MIQACAEAHKQDGCWLLPEMIEAYKVMHNEGYAHSVEIWQGDELIGGVYGILIKQVFFAESMFSRVRDGSKMALAKLVEKAQGEAWLCIDCQFHTAHLESLGAKEISRSQFLAFLQY